MADDTVSSKGEKDPERVQNMLHTSQLSRHESCEAYMRLVMSTSHN